MVHSSYILVDVACKICPCYSMPKRFLTWTVIYLLEGVVIVFYSIGRGSLELYALLIDKFEALNHFLTFTKLPNPQVIPVFCENLFNFSKMYLLEEKINILNLNGPPLPQTF